MPAFFSSLEQWELGSVLAYELAALLDVKITNGPPPPVRAARLREEKARAGCQGLFVLVVSLPNFIAGSTIMIFARNQEPFIRWGIGGVFAVAGAVFAAYGWFYCLKRKLRGYVLLMAMLVGFLGVIQIFR